VVAVVVPVAVSPRPAMTVVDNLVEGVLEVVRDVADQIPHRVAEPFGHVSCFPSPSASRIPGKTRQNDRQESL
jgi:hypothetical protein